MDRSYDDEDEMKAESKGKLRYEFECPECNAHNPYHDGFALGSEVLCFYCGQEFKVAESDGKWKFKPV
ncbi:MAG: hypothetical protein HYS27_21500 [Deltaproteobacteria bacterium]|nr:hypothetical protein [Deltaproteobacteria bacterium]